MKQKRAHKRALPEPPKPRREVPRVNADPEQGLSLHQVKERQQHGWANDPVESPTKTVGEIVRENVCTFFNFIFVVLAALLIAVGSFEDMLFLLIAAANTGIGIFQQLRSKQTIDKLNLLAAPRANVVREGNLISVPSAQLVRDDVAELSSGDQIPADATVLSGQIQVNEALITGEADAITKAPGDELLSGSFVVSGRCRARLDRVGAESYAARLTTEAKKDVTVGKSEMMSSLDKLIRVIGILLVPIAMECGMRLAWVSYAALSLLSILFVPDKESAFIFVFLLGHYPLLKAYLQRIPWRWLRAVVKTVVFNALVFACYGVVLYILPIQAIVQEFAHTAPAALAGLLVLLAVLLAMLLWAVLHRRRAAGKTRKGGGAHA